MPGAGAAEGGIIIEMLRMAIIPAPETFDLHYVVQDGKFHSPFMINRANQVSQERFIGI